MSRSTPGVKWRTTGNSYVVRVPNDALNGGTGRRWYAIADGRGLGHFRNKRNAIAAIYKVVLK